MNGQAARKRILTKDVVAKRSAMNGLLSIVRVLLRARRLKRARPPDVTQLDARMRRDIGLRTEYDVPDFRTLR